LDKGSICIFILYKNSKNVLIKNIVIQLGSLGQNSVVYFWNFFMLPSQPVLSPQKLIVR